ncbi:MAG: hypothetical protein SAJ37_00475 [Oscillatoria sp. PMC 1068.18]|nr:hypothetical protein [Oscillatoria sp. PMC 1076.18]MEC4987196.1 hypothetical protein [Oscillatoria sp. PMC 1068.18]
MVAGIGDLEREREIGAIAEPGAYCRAVNQHRNYSSVWEGDS